MVSESQRRASAKYDKFNTKTFALKLNLTNDADIISKLKSVDNVQGYLKKLVRNDMAR